jgi:hypothetical protein
MFKGRWGAAGGSIRGFWKSFLPEIREVGACRRTLPFVQMAVLGDPARRGMFDIRFFSPESAMMFRSANILSKWLISVPIRPSWEKSVQHFWGRETGLSGIRSHWFNI